ncbi:MAG: DnaJ domain-containing protein [Henriciella sp.]|nr:DnaJ domain-containing protein [Henriciella sp.]
MTAPQAYPLSWPAHRPRTEASRRKTGQFKSTRQAFTIALAADRVEEQIDLFGAKQLIISTNVPPTLSGRPRSGQGAPADPGVALYFQKGGEPITLACDTYTKVEQNLAALAAHIEAVRKIERYGVQTAKEILRAFSALPPPSKQRPARKAWEVLGVARTASASEVRAAYRKLSARAHPDAGGDRAEWDEISSAYEDMMFLLGEKV